MKKIICCMLVAVLAVIGIGCGRIEPVSAPADTPEPVCLTVPDELDFGMKESEIIKLYGEPDWEYGDIISYKRDNGFQNFDKQEFVLGITEKGLQMVQYAFGYSYDNENTPYLSDTRKRGCLLITTLRKMRK